MDQWNKSNDTDTVCMANSDAYIVNHAPSHIYNRKGVSNIM